MTTVEGLRAQAKALAPAYREMGTAAGRAIKTEWQAIPPKRRKRGLAALAAGGAALAIGAALIYASSPELRKTIKTEAGKIRRKVMDDVRSFLADPSSQQAGEQTSTEAPGAARTDSGHAEPTGAEPAAPRQTRELATTAVT